MSNGKKLDLLQTFFVSSFLLSALIMLISWAMCFIFHNFQVEFVEKYYGLDAEELGNMVVFLFGLWKIFVIQFTLIPALVLWGMKKCCKCKCDCENDNSL